MEGQENPNPGQHLPSHPLTVQPCTGDTISTQCDTTCDTISTQGTWTGAPGLKQKLPQAPELGISPEDPLHGPRPDGCVASSTILTFPGG